MDQAEAVKRVAANVELPLGSPQPVGFFIEIIIAGVVGWLIKRCLDRVFPANARNPGLIARWRLKHAIYDVCHEAGDTPEGIALNLDGHVLRELYAKPIYQAFLKTGRETPEPELLAFQATCQNP